MKKNILKRISLLAFVIFVVVAFTGCLSTTDLDMEKEASTSSTSEGEEVQGIGIHHAEIEVKDYGTIKLELDGDSAPITVQNFMDLANAGFYDGLTFHRIMDGFMIQGGDPEGNGTGGSGTSIFGEFSTNGFENPISHAKGTISMARASDPNSASSQFFIMVEDGLYLDGNYAGFGHVTEGQDIADKIAKDAVPIDNNGTIPPADQPVIVSIKITD